MLRKNFPRKKEKKRLEAERRNSEYQKLSPEEKLVRNPKKAAK